MDCGLFGVRFLFLGHKNGAAAPVDYLSTFATAPSGSIITKETFKASNLPVTDTHGIMGDSGSTVMSQELFDAVAEKIMNELVSNEKLNTVLTEKLADYIMKSKIVNHLLATDESTVLSGPMGKELKGLIDVLNTKKIGTAGSPSDAISYMKYAWIDNHHTLAVHFEDGQERYLYFDT